MELCKSACTIASNSRQLKVMNIVKAKDISNMSNYFQNGNGSKVVVVAKNATAASYCIIGEHKSLRTA